MATDITRLGKYAGPCDIEAQLLENLDFDTGCGDSSKAQQFIIAARAWLLTNPTRVAKGGTSSEDVVLSVPQVKSLLDEAIAVRDRLLAAAADAGGVRHFSMECYR